MLSKRLTLIVVPEGRASARRVRVPSLALVPVILVTMASLYGLGLIIYQRETIGRLKRQVVGIADENANLKRQNSMLSVEAGRLSGKVEEIAHRTRQFQTALGFDSGLSGAFGLGGPMEDPSLSSIGDKLTGRLHLADLASLRQQALHVDARLRSVETVFRVRSELVASVPSIPPLQGGEVSSPYGYRFDPFTGVRSFHPALDITNDRGASVVATADGVVTAAGYESGYGMAVEVSHGYGFSTRYAHLLNRKVKVGQRVKKGEIIGLVGSTGRSTGYHLHYEVRIDNEPVDPMPYMVELTEQGTFAARLERSLLRGAKALE